jgi:hypothetical protein
VQTRLGDPEVPRDLRQRRLALTSDRDHVTTELRRERFRHAEHPSSEDESSQARSQPSWGQSLTRRTAEGKTRKEIRRCLKRYLARKLYRLLENGPTTAAPAKT